MNKLKNIFALFILLMLGVFLVSAHGEETFTKAEEIIDSKIPCNQLTDVQLDIIGDYYMSKCIKI